MHPQFFNSRRTGLVAALLLSALIILALGLLAPHLSKAQTREQAPQRAVQRALPETPAVPTQTDWQFTAAEHGAVLEIHDGCLDCRAATAEEMQALGRAHNQPLHVLRDEALDLGAPNEQAQPGLKIVMRGTPQLEQFPEAKAAFLRAARAWESLIQNPITVVIDVDFGPTFFGQPFGGFGGLTNAQTLTRPNAYPLVREELIKSAGSPLEAALYRALPPERVMTNQGPTTEMSYASALLRALGRIAPVADPANEPAAWGPPPRIGFNSTHNFDFDPSDGIKTKRADFTGLALHEIGHALGFTSGVGEKELRLDLPPNLSVLDLFRFRPGVTSETFGTALRVLSSGGEQVFFGGVAELPLSTGRNDSSGGDGRQPGHWKDVFLTRRYLGVMDPQTNLGYRYELTANDREAFERMGYRANPLPNPREAELKLDDGTIELGYFEDNLMFVNRLTPPSYPATLRTLRLMVPLLRDTPNATGQPLTLLIGAANNANGQPPPSAEFTRLETTVPSASHELFLEFPIPNGPTINSGDFYVGFQAPAPHRGVSFAVDHNGAAAKRSFFSEDNGASFELLTGEGGLAANAMIRALVAIGGPEPTPTPTPAPTPTPTPNPVTVALVSGVPQNGYIEKWGPYTGFASETQYAIQVPNGATQLKLEVEANTDLDFYGRLGSRVGIQNGFAIYDFKVESDEHHEAITLTPSSSPALRAGVYYVMLVNFGPGSSTFKITATVTGGAPPGRLANVSAATFKGEELASGMIVAAFGEKLATGTATDARLPTTLRGTTVNVTDSRGVLRSAQLFFVSPAQVNYLLPYETALGPATVTVTSGDGVVSSGAVQIAAVAPGLFTANGDGQGVPAAVALRVRPGATPSYEPVAQYDAAQRRFVPRPIDLGAANEQVFLILFGTGWRNAPRANLQIGGVAAPVTFAGAAPGNPGVAQLNAALPRTLIGRGDVDVVLTVEGKTANTVRIKIK